MQQFPDIPKKTTGHLAVWDKAGMDRNAYAIQNLNIAFTVYYDDDDKEHQGDIRYDSLQRQEGRPGLASEGGRWRGEGSLEPLRISNRELVRGQTYALKQLPLGSVFAMPNGREHTLHMYNYHPKPSKGAEIEFDIDDDTSDNGRIVKKGRFTEFGNTEVVFMDHPHLIRKPTKSAATAYSSKKRQSPNSAASRLKVPSWLSGRASPRAAVRTPSRTSKYKKKAADRMRRVASARGRRRRKATSKARSVSADKLDSMRSTTRRRSR